MPRYRMPDPSWKAKQPRPTPMGLCAEAAAEIAGAFVSTVAEWPDAERALDRLGLGGDDNARLLAERARRGLDALRVDGGVKLLALAERVVIARDAAEQRGPEEVASQALRDFEHEPVATIAESAYLRTRSLASAAPTIQDAALALLRELCSELAAALGRDVRKRELVTRPPSSATPVEAPPPRATPDDLARRIVTSLERGKRDPRAALVAMHELGAKLDERQQRLVAEAVLDHLAGARAGRSSLSERLARARFRIGAVDGPLLLPLGDRSRVHLWRSDGTDDLATVATLCGSPIRAGGSWKRIFDMPQRRDDDDDVFGFGRSRSACPSCLAAAREDGPYPAPVSRSEWPGEHYEVAIATVLALEVGGRGWDWDDPVDDVVRDSVRDMVVADATRLGVVCAQRTLGPVRYLKEQEALSAPLGGQLTADDWATIVGAVDVRLAKELVRCAHAREVPSRAVLRLVTPAPPSDDGHS